MLDDTGDSRRRLKRSLLLCVINSHDPLTWGFWESNAEVGRLAPGSDPTCGLFLYGQQSKDSQQGFKLFSKRGRRRSGRKERQTAWPTEPNVFTIWPFSQPSDLRNNSKHGKSTWTRVIFAVVNSSKAWEQFKCPGWKTRSITLKWFT